MITEAEIETALAKNDGVGTHGNVYTTTLHVINSSCIKLGKLTSAAKVHMNIYLFSTFMTYNSHHKSRVFLFLLLVFLLFFSFFFFFFSFFFSWLSVSGRSQIFVLLLLLITIIRTLS